MKNVTFSVGLKDSFGDIIETGIYIHIEERMLALRFLDLDHLKEFIEDLNVCAKEIGENYES